MKNEYSELVINYNRFDKYRSYFLSGRDRSRVFSPSEASIGTKL